MMRHSRIVLALATVSLAAVSLVSGVGAQQECPDIGVRLRAGSVTASEVIVCESGTRIQIGSQIGGDHGGKATCPAVVITQPAFNEPVPMKGF
jgi:hypothetical protein